MKTKFLTGIILSSAFFIVSCGLPRDIQPTGPVVRSWRGPQVWQNDINAFVNMDKAGLPPANAVLFMGSSSVKMWDIKKYFPDLPAINRAFGGSYISDSANYADTIAAPYKPRLIVIYAGDNDVTDGKPPARVAGDFNYFLGAVRTKLPQVPVIYISIKPSPARWQLWPRMQEANELIKKSCEMQQPCQVLDVGPAMLGSNDKPKPELFLADGLHMSDQGYRIWTDLLTPLLKGP